MKWLFEVFSGMGIAMVTILIIALIIFGPFISIWALNTLFGLGIAYTFKTWIAMLILHTILSQSSSSNTKEN